MKVFKNKSLSGIWFYRLVRWAFAAFFIAVGFLYQDASVAFIFGGIFLVTSFFTPERCLRDGCNIDTIKE
jgi:hypothetical protein